MFTVSDMWGRTWIKSNEVSRITIYNKERDITFGLSGEDVREEYRPINFDNISIELKDVDGSLYLTCQRNPGISLKQRIDECTQVHIVFLPFEELPTDFWRGETEELQPVVIYKAVKYKGGKWIMTPAVLRHSQTQDVQEEETKEEE